MQNHELNVSPGPEAVIFDLEGTIIDTERLWDECAEILLSRRGRTYDPTLSKHDLMGRTPAEGAAILMDHYDFEGDPEEIGTERKAIFFDLLEKDVDFVPGFERFYARVSPNYPTAIASSMDRRLFDQVDKRLHLTKLFKEHAYFIGDIGFVAKPNPDIFLYAAAQLKVNPQRCVVIEDAPHGVTAARAAEMYAVAITTSIGREYLTHADQIVDHFDEIKLPA